MKWLKHYREKVGLSQKELADKVGVQENTVWRWENGKSIPSLATAKKISEILNTTERELLNGPKKEHIEITLSWDWGEMEEGEINMTGDGFTLVLGEAGQVGIKGSATFTNKEALKDFAKRIIEQLEFGFDAQVRRGIIKE